MPSLHPDLQTAMTDTAKGVERMLERLLPQGGLAEARLHDAMRYGALGGGKRLRPFLVMGAASLFNVDETRALRTPRRQLQHGRIVGQRKHLFGHARRRHRPKSRSRSAGEYDGHDRYGLRHIGSS